MVEAAIWSTKKIRDTVMIDPTKSCPTNPRPGCEGETICDFGDHVGLIWSTHWGPSPFARAVAGFKDE